MTSALPPITAEQASATVACLKCDDTGAVTLCELLTPKGPLVGFAYCACPAGRALEHYNENDFLNDWAAELEAHPERFSTTLDPW